MSATLPGEGSSKGARPRVVQTRSASRGVRLGGSASGRFAMTTAGLRRHLAATAAATVFALARSARADDEAGEKKNEVKEQMLKIVELMRENERALLDASRGEDAAPKRVDV